MKRRRGFTLIELVLVFSILAVGTAVAVPAFLRLAHEDDLTIATRTLHNVFKIARDSAIAGGTPVTVVVDSISGLVWLDTPPRVGEASWAAAQAAASPSSLFESGTSGPVAFGSGSSTLQGGRFVDANSITTFGTELNLPGSVRLVVPSARARFTFSPGGQAFSDSLVLIAPSGRRTVTLDIGTGDVRVR